ncbi:RagB/SusD family nutrient uptake outer membrane protein [Flavobacterium sp. MK4S-17]|uniref:RagB/SusD family nutrient uptake outer membrane protein n=1 Tax=Flavobacterium sp. MK4S-17 TaxID=2543737 RepID=UPI00135CCCEA|nr:RagB/SusD family nutrient uptake outer membrane protein [Flavobacterium sp. MK4S-17]
MKNIKAKFINRNYRKLLFPLQCFVLSLFITQCESFNDVDLPNSQLTGQAVFESTTTANAAMAHIYASLRDSGLLTGNSNGLSNQLGHYTDELAFYGASSHFSAAFSNNSLIPSDLNVRSIWNDSYNQIYACNAIIEGVRNAPLLPVGDRERLEGEALFVRALVHFYLANLYGPVPYITTTDYSVTRSATRVPVDVVYQNVTTDLLAALPLLSDTYSNPERVIPNRKVVQAFLSRVYLYSGVYDQAIASASILIDDTATFQWESDLNDVFLKDASTTIWQFSPSLAGSNTLEATNFIFNAGPPPLVALSPALMTAFEPGDIRKSVWTKEISNDNGTWYHAFKYKQNAATASSVEYSIVLRLAEQYLIRAEAYARLGAIEAAKNDLDLIRATAGLPATSAESADDILSAILQERKIEFFTEHGHRFFDLKRYGRLDIDLSLVKPGWDTTDALWPLPETELLTNPNLGNQNPGY